MEKPHQIEVTHESHYAPIRNPDQSQAIALVMGVMRARVCARAPRISEQPQMAIAFPCVRQKMITAPRAILGLRPQDS
jgi:hypothetical protein